MNYASVAAKTGYTFAENWGKREKPNQQKCILIFTVPYDIASLLHHKSAV